MPLKDKALVAAGLRTIFAQPDRREAGQHLIEVAHALEGRWPQAAAVLRAAEDDVLAYMAFLHDHWARLHSTNILERLNREVKRRTDVVGSLPDLSSALRLVGAVLLEIDDEWQVKRRYFSQESICKLTDPAPEAGSAGPLRLAPVC